MISSWAAIGGAQVIRIEEAYMPTAPVGSPPAFARSQASAKQVKPPKVPL